MGYVHLDIKPTNFLVNSKGYVKIGDFGNSVLLGYDKKFVEGDNRYIANELLNLDISQLDYKVDLFALGMSCLELLFKLELPNEGNLWKELRMGIRNASIPDDKCPLTSLGELADFLDCLTQPNPVDRMDFDYYFGKFAKFSEKLTALNFNNYKSELLDFFNQMTD